MSKFKVEFTLNQHTPIIHFQSEQQGATLRATELKPKFDRFLKEHAFDGEIPEEFLIPKQDNALDYKVRVEQNMSAREEISDKDPLFFGNIKPPEMTEREWELKKKRFKNCNKSFKIKFISFNEKMRKIIEDKFEAFISQTNFGTRQSKGFGSFFLDNKKFNPSLLPFKTYNFSTNDWEKDIGLLYQFLRQGINLPRPNNPFYTKPAIFSYAKIKGWQWDKKSIKEECFSANLDKQIKEHSPSDVLEYSSEKKYLLRDLFGLSSSQKWKSYNNVSIEKEDVKKDERGKPVIERFKSPITFKIIDNTVYFWADETINDILDKEFNIKAGRGNDSLNLFTPPEFNFDDFFDFTFNKLNISQHIKSDFHNVNEYKNLNRIISNIKASI